jgi:hypothetical protein
MTIVNRPNRFAPALLVVLSAAASACIEDSPGVRADDANPDGSVSPGSDAGDGRDRDGAVASSCAPATGPGTTHDSVTADETWTAAGSPHIVARSLAIAAGRTVTIEPCAVVRMNEDVSILVEGKLLAIGAADQRIRIGRGDDGAPWRTIEARRGAEIRFAFVTLEGGGAPGNEPLTRVGALDIRGDQESAPQPVFFADHVTVRNSASLGILVREGGAFAPGSQALTVTGGASFPISIWGRAAGTLPPGAYTANAIDEIILPAMGGRDDIKEDTTLAARGVPYRIGGPSGGKSLTIAAAGVPRLTIEPGVKLRFEKDARLLVDSSGSTPLGALVARGTADKPIVFESAAATPAAGDWVGIVIEGTPDPRTAIAHAKITHAGGASQISSYGCPSPGAPSFGNEAAILIIGGEAPTTGFVTNTIVEQSAGEGIVRGWTGDPVDFLATNTFTGIARCNQTFPKPAASVCPNPAPCPK